MKKILLIANDFPPYVGRGNVMRILKFAKYLPSFGWQPFIICEEKDKIEDKSLLQELSPNIKIFYIKRDTPHKKKKRYKKILANNNNLGIFKYLYYLSYRALIFNIYAFYMNYFLIPDKSIYWAEEILKHVNHLHKKYNFDLFLTSGPPFSIFKTGFYIKQILKIPWVLDFRDGWVGNPLYADVKKSFIQWRNKYIEKKAILSSDLNIFVTDPLREIYMKRYPDVAAQMSTITNGFDFDDIVNIDYKKRKKNTLHILYSGSVGGLRSPNPFLNSVLTSINENNELKEHLKITFLGRFIKNREYWQSQLKFVFQHIDLLPHKEALEKMAEADVFLILINPLEGGRTVMTGKIFEYLALQKPIFAVSNSCAATDLIKKFNIGYVADYFDEQGIKKQIFKIYDDFKNSQMNKKVDPGMLAQFDRKNLTKKLSEQLNRLTV